VGFDIRHTEVRRSASAAVDLFWIPLGAGAHIVRWNGKVYEAIKALAQRRPRCDLYHSALEVTVPQGRFVIEVTPIPDQRGPEAASSPRARLGPEGPGGSGCSATRSADGAVDRSPMRARRSRARSASQPTLNVPNGYSTWCLSYRRPCGAETSWTRATCGIPTP
jgi:hypothetical protein